MNKVEFDSLPGGTPPAHRERLFAAARSYRQMETAAYKSFSGADVAEAPLQGLTADALACLAEGKDLEATIVLFRAKWIAYCAENNAKVASAPKIKRGPSAGHSVIGHRHCSPESFDSKAIFLRSMMRVEVTS